MFITEILKRASGDHAFAKIIRKYCLSTIFFSILFQMWSVNIYLLNYISAYFYSNISATGHIGAGTLW